MRISRFISSGRHFLVLATSVALVLSGTRSVPAQSTDDLLNLNFAGSGNNKVGLAATGVSTNDAWNLITNIASGTFTNLVTADSNACAVTVTVTNLPYYSSNAGFQQWWGPIDGPLQLGPQAYYDFVTQHTSQETNQVYDQNANDYVLVVNQALLDELNYILKP